MKPASKIPGLPKEASDAPVWDKMERFKPITNDLRKTQAAFVLAYVDILNQTENQEAKDGTKNCEMLTKGGKYKMGLEKWMSSALRAVLMGGKKKDFAIEPTDWLGGNFKSHFSSRK